MTTPATRKPTIGTIRDRAMRYPITAAVTTSPAAGPRNSGGPSAAAARTVGSVTAPPAGGRTPRLQGRRVHRPPAGALCGNEPPAARVNTRFGVGPGGYGARREHDTRRVGHLRRGAARGRGGRRPRGRHRGPRR